MSTALESDQAKTLGIGVIVAIVVIGLVVGMIISALIGRLIVLAVVVALGAFVWVQREAIQGHVKKCDATFLGIHLTPSDPHLKQLCQNATNQ